MQPWRIGIDLGAAKIGFGLVNADNQIVARHRLLTEAEKGPQAVVERILEGVTVLQKQLPAGDSISAVGVCAPGPVDHKKGGIN